MMNKWIDRLRFRLMDRCLKLQGHARIFQTFLAAFPANILASVVDLLLGVIVFESRLLLLFLFLASYR